MLGEREKSDIYGATHAVMILMVHKEAFCGVYLRLDFIHNETSINLLHISLLSAKPFLHM